MLCSTFKEWKLLYFVESDSKEYDWCVLCQGEGFPVKVGKSEKEKLDHWNRYHKPSSIFKSVFWEIKN